MSKNIAIILAAGSGKRFGENIPKQFENLNGRLVIDYSMQVFLNNKFINGIIIVSNHQWMDSLIDRYPECKVIAGGETRQESSFLGLRACPKGTHHVLIHDSARPFISNQIINNIVEKLRDYDAVNLSVPTSDTVVYSKNKLVQSIPNREEFFLSQTPQSFKYDIILEAHEKSTLNDASDDIQLVKDLNIECYNLMGLIENIKITHPLDIKIAELIIQNNI
tara:strand:+ start:135 stop:797 length:663 start_codon:yes stop_codon:yes gene_type:complete